MAKKSSYEKDPIYKACVKIANYVYKIFDDIPNDEMYGAMYYARNRASLIVSDSALAIANLTFYGNEYEWSIVSKNVAALHSSIIFYIDKGHVKKDQKILDLMEQVISESDKNAEKAKQDTDNKQAKDKEDWKKRYNQWQEMRKTESTKK